MGCTAVGEGRAPQQRMCLSTAQRHSVDLCGPSLCSEVHSSCCVERRAVACGSWFGAHAEEERASLAEFLGEGRVCWLDWCLLPSCTPQRGPRRCARPRGTLGALSDMLEAEGACARRLFPSWSSSCSFLGSRCQRNGTL